MARVNLVHHTLRRCRSSSYLSYFQ